MEPTDYMSAVEDNFEVVLQCIRDNSEKIAKVALTAIAKYTISRGFDDPKEVVLTGLCAITGHYALRMRPEVAALIGEIVAEALAVDAQLSAYKVDSVEWEGLSTDSISITCSVPKEKPERLSYFARLSNALRKPDATFVLGAAYIAVCVIWFKACL